MSALTPTTFPEANKNIGKPVSMSDLECKRLDIYTDGKQCISCWKMSWMQRVQALLFGKIWLSVLTGDTTQPPVWLDCGKTVFVAQKEE